MINYNKKEVKLQLIEIVKKCKKVNSVDDLVNHLDWLIELAREDVFNITKSKKIYFSDFDYFFNEAVLLLKNQLKKTHLRAVNNFFKNGIFENALKWIISRIINNMKNISTNPRYKLYLDLKIEELNEHITGINEIEKIIIEESLKKLNYKLIKNQILELINNMHHSDEFDNFDLKYLIEKFNVKLDTEYQKLNIKTENINGNNLQLIFDFN